MRSPSDANKLVHQLVVESREDPTIVFTGGGQRAKKNDDPQVPSRKTILKWTQRLFMDEKEAERVEVERRHKLELKGEGHGLLGFG